MSHDFSFDPPIDGGVVVGIDGSPLAARALAWAWREASARRLPLHVVRAWTLADALPEVDSPLGVVPSLAECAAAVESETAQEINRTGAAVALDDPGLADRAPEPTVHVIHGHAAEVLVAATGRADLVVVGHRGHNHLTLVLGSVAAHVLEHARCPVVVIPAP